MTKLQIVPLKAIVEADRIKQECIKQGKLWWGVLGGLHCAYEGITAAVKGYGSSPPGLPPPPPTLEQRYVSLFTTCILIQLADNTL